MSFRALYPAGYGNMAEERRRSAEWLHEKKENVGKSIGALLDDPSSPIPTGEPFIPKPLPPVKNNTPTTNGLRFIVTEDPVDELARSIALGSELVNIARTTNFIEVLNRIIEVNNAFYSEPEMQKRGKIYNWDLDISHGILREGRMPYWQESDKEALIHGRIDDLSRIGKIAQVIYAMPLAAIIEAVRRKQKERQAYLDHMGKKPVGLDADLWQEQGKRRGIDGKNVKILIHKKSGREVLGGATCSMKSDEIEMILHLPKYVYFALDGTIIDMAWGWEMSEFQKTRELQNDTRLQVALAADG